MRRAFKVKLIAFFIISEGFQLSEIVSDLRVCLKMELFVTNVNGWKLLLLLQRVPSYMLQGPRCRSTSEKHR